MHFSILRKDLTASTNDDVWELASQGAAEGAVVVARSQRQGRGQWGRVWVSPEGGLYFSLLLRPGIPQSKWPLISPAIARAVCRVARMECGVDPAAFWVESVPGEDAASGDAHAANSGGIVGSIVQGVRKLTGSATPDATDAAALCLADTIHVKHPNDVVCDAGKVCGISLEARDGCVVVGCGVNVFHPDRPIETDGRNVPAYLVDLAQGRLGTPSGEYLDALLDALLVSMAHELESLE